MEKSSFRGFFRSRFFINLLVIGSLLVAISIVLASYSRDFRFFLVSFLLVIAAAATGKFVNDVSLKTTFKPGLELHFYAGIMITYFSNPWIGSFALLFSFYLMNRIQPMFKIALGRQPVNNWMFVEGIMDMIHYVFLELSMWLYIVLLFLMSSLEGMYAPIMLWNLVSLLGSMGDAILNKFVPVDRPDDIGRAPWKRLIVYFLLFNLLSPLLVMFVFHGTLNL